MNTAAFGAARSAADELIALVQDPGAAVTARLSAGVRLGEIGDPRPGVLTLAPEWCRVSEGTFQMGAEPSGDAEAFEREAPSHELFVEAFDIARYPVTNGQWQRFVDARGYADYRWWIDDGWDARKANGWSAPRTWNDTGWAGNQPNRPVVGVSWYEAIAFANWLSAELGYQVGVCTEPEWEKAARGRDGRRYPFGNTLDTGALHVCTTEPRWASAPAPVGCYPRGSSPWGLEDMVGNTYSWTVSRWGVAEDIPSFAYPYVADDGRESLESDDYRVVRGGAWSFPLENSRCSYRGKDLPHSAFNNLGVRLVRRRSPESGPRSSVFGKEQRS